MRSDEATITDTLCMLTADAYIRLVRDAGWPTERYQDWLTDVLLACSSTDMPEPVGAEIRDSSSVAGGVAIARRPQLLS